MGKILFLTAIMSFSILGIHQERVNAQQCDAILHANLFNSYTSRSNNIHASALSRASCSMDYETARYRYDRRNSAQRQYCNMSYEQAAESSSGGGSGGVNLPELLGGIGISGKGHSSRESFQEWKSENCGSSARKNSLNSSDFKEWKSRNCSAESADKHASASAYLAQKTVASDVVQAWRDCMLEKEGLSCWASPREDHIEINISWKDFSVELPRVTGSYLSDSGVVRGRNVQRGELLERDKKVFIGKDTIIVRRVDPRESVVGSLTLVHRERFSHSCRVFIPPENDDKRVMLPFDPRYIVVNFINRNRIKAVEGSRIVDFEEDIGKKLICGVWPISGSSARVTASQELMRMVGKAKQNFFASYYSSFLNTLEKLATDPGYKNWPRGASLRRDRAIDGGRRYSLCDAILLHAEGEIAEKPLTDSYSRPPTSRIPIFEQLSTAQAILKGGDMEEGKDYQLYFIQ